MKVSPSAKVMTQQDFLSSTSFYLRSSLREARRRKLYFCLAITSTFIVVAATAVSQTVIDYTPLIFLKSSESDTGAIDVRLECLDSEFKENDGLNDQTVAKNLLLNSTAIEAQIEPIYPSATTARYTFKEARVKKGSGVCNSNSNPCYSASFDLQNTKRETELGMATDPKLPNDIPYGGIIISAKYAKMIEATVGNTLYVNLVVSELLKEVAIQYNSKQSLMSDKISQSTFSGRSTTIPFRVVAIVDSMSGKYPDGTYDAIITEYQHFFTILSNYMPPSLSYALGNSANYQKFLLYLRNETPKNYANQVLFNIKDRMEVYRESNFDIIQDKVTQFGSKISDTLGVFPYDMKLPVLAKLGDLKFGGLFLGIVMTIIIVVLFILSTLLIYNLLLVTVETKSFEFGVIRMIGLKKQGIAHLILAQALLFALPGVILGLFVSVPLLSGIGSVLEELLSTKVPIIPSGTALLWSILLGIAIPILSSYYPMKSALGKNLNLSLDLVHSKTNAVQVSIEIGSKQFPWAQVAFGVLSVLFGIGIYIVLPLSMVSYDLGLLLGLFFLILIGLLVGLTILSLNFQHLMARLVTAICFFWTSASFRSLILKNLLAHKLRNRQTSIMYSLALGFIIFILVSLNQELTSMAYSAQQSYGARLWIRSKNYLPTTELEDLMTGKFEDIVESYAFISHDLADFVIDSGLYTEVSLTHEGHLYTYPPIIRAVSPSIYQTTINDFLVASVQDENTGLDLGQQLYTPRGSQGIIMGEGIRKKLGITEDLYSPVLLELKNGVNSRTEVLRVIASLDSSPVFTFSAIPAVDIQDVLISLPMFASIANNVTSSINDIPIEKMIIKVKGDSPEYLEEIYDELNKIRQEDDDIGLWSYLDTEKTIKSNQDTLNFLFKAVEILVMLLSMFSLITSMSTNIMDQTKEIAVLRAIGMTRLKVNMLYVSEAFVLIISSAIFGIIIGTAVAWTLSIQRVLFTQLPLIFTFPGVDLVIIFAVAVFSAFVSSYFPAKKVTKHEISKVIRLGG